MAMFNIYYTSLDGGRIVVWAQRELVAAPTRMSGDKRVPPHSPILAEYCLYIVEESLGVGSW